MKYRHVASELKSTLDDFFAVKAGVFERAVEDVVKSLQAGGRILVFGNGGSAAEAQHFAAELVNKFTKERRPIPAMALTTDTSCLTSIGNDIAFKEIFSRQVDAHGRPGDVAIALTTSGASANVIQGLKAARSKGLKTVAFTGAGGCATDPATIDHLLAVPATLTPRIQEAHLVLLHLMAEEIENRLA
jgi:D-sedoheptulose 7-phosphate isomerase